MPDGDVATTVVGGIVDSKDLSSVAERPMQLDHTTTSTLEHLAGNDGIDSVSRLFLC
jgi:hypothetical protein